MPDIDAIRLEEGSPNELRSASIAEEEEKKSKWYDAAFHNVTAMVGAGVLGLPSTFATLGWAGGLIVLVGSLGISWYTFGLLTHLHEGENEDGSVKRHNRYHELCQAAYGKVKGVWIILSFQLPFLYGLAVTYSVTGGQNLASFAAIIHTNGASSSPNYFFNQAFWIIIFSVVELIVAQLPDLGSLGWVSGVGAAMSVLYSVGGSALALNTALPRSEVNYNPGTIQDTQPTYITVLSIFSAITTVFFAFGGHNIALEIQSILPHPPGTVKPMMKGVHTAFVLTIGCYLLVAITGFYSFGVRVQGNVLNSVGADPLGLLAACYFAVVLHVTASYQVYSFPIYDLLEIEFDRLANPALAHSLDPNKDPKESSPTAQGTSTREDSKKDQGGWFSKFLRFLGPRARRQIIRIVYICSTCFIACLIPFFDDLMGLIGALGATPTTFVIPCLLWLTIKRPTPWISYHWWLCWVIAIVASCIGLIGAAGALYNIVEDSKMYKIFGIGGTPQPSTPGPALNQSSQSSLTLNTVFGSLINHPGR